MRGTGGTIPGTSTTLADVGDVIKSPAELVKWIGGNWDRVLEVVGGLVLVIVGLVLMGRSLGVTKTKIEVVERRLPGGAERQTQRDAAAAEDRAYTRAAATAGRRRALGSPEPRRRRVRPLDDEPRVRTTGPGQSEEIPY